MKMNKAFLVSVIATGCISRFRNGEQFTKTAKEIEVDESELATLESDSYLQVKVISEFDDDEFDDSELVVPEADQPQTADVIVQQADFIDAGANDDDAGKDTAVSSVVTPLSKDVPPDDTITLSAKASVIVDELENEPTPQADADTDTAALPEAAPSEAQSTPVSEAPVNHLDTIVEAMRGLNLDRTAGKPTVYDLQALGLDISAKERDAAWDVLVK